MHRPSLIAAAVALAAHCATARAQVDADTLKAAFIYNFAVYTTWPAPVRDSGTLALCVDGTSSLLPALRRLEGKVVQNRSLAVRETGPDGTEVDACDILILSAAKSGSVAAVRGLLTVCDCDEPHDRPGATIALVREGDRLRFDVDRQHAAAAGLSLSSKLLRLARMAP